MSLKISELVSELSKVQAAVGDLPVKFRALEGGAETVLRSIGIDLTPGQASGQGTVTIKHGDAPPEPAQAEAPAEQPAGHDDQVAGDPPMLQN